jgi:hypothetical protein
MDGSGETTSGVTGEPGVAYDTEKLGEPGQPGVPQGDQYPTNKDDEREIVADVDIPGPYPSGRGDPTGEPLSSETEHPEATRTGGSLGDLTKDVSTSTMREDTGGLGSPIFDDEKHQDK